MRIITEPTLRDFGIKHAPARSGLELWKATAKRAHWSSFHDIQKDFPRASSVGNEVFVFDINGNNYRLITRIVFNGERIYILQFWPHAKYTQVIKDTSWMDKVGP